MELIILILVLGGFITLYILTMFLNEKVAVPESCKAAYLEAQSCESCGSKGDKETKGSCGFSNTLEFFEGGQIIMTVLYPFIVLGLLGILLGIVLSLANRYLTIEEDPRIDAIEKLLPNYNCGACGTPGCRAFATGIVNGEVLNLSRCKPGKLEKHFNPILEYLKDHPNPDGTKLNVKV